MKKQTIKLNESQLRNIIKEALNELDWKTYANAAQKDAERQSDEYNQRKSRGEKLSPEEIVGMFKRPMKFRTAAIDALNKKYKEDNEDGYDFFATQHGSPLNKKAKYYANVENRTGEGYGYASSTEDGKTFKSQPLTRQTRLKNKGREITVSPERIFGSPNYDKVKKLKDFASEVGNYNQGNYDYSTEKGWHLKESQLRSIIKRSIKKVLKESERREIFTIDIFDIENENSIDDMQYARDYKSADEAIQAAREVAHKYADYDSVINVFVMAGEYMDENGDIFGEPDAIYCISNKDKRTTMIARKNAGYSSLESDEYIG